MNDPSRVLHVVTVLVTLVTATNQAKHHDEHRLPFPPGSAERRAVASYHTPYTIIRPYAREWNATFMSFFPHLTTPSPLHVWLQCYAASPGTFAVYFMLEDMQKRMAGVDWRPPRVPANMLVQHLHLHLDGRAVSYGSIKRKDVDLYLRCVAPSWTLF